MKKKQKKMLRRILIALALYIVLMVAQHLFPLEQMKLIYLPLYLIPYFIVGYDVLRKAVQGVVNRQPFDESLLMTIATIGAMVLGEYPEGVAVMLFYQIGEFFQSYAVGKSRRSISALMDIRPEYANLERDGAIEEVDPESVEIGSVIVIKPGERVPLDGVVLEGESALNMAALTGESVPQDVAPGAQVISGSVNLTGVLRLRTEKRYEDSTVARILELEPEHVSCYGLKLEEGTPMHAQYLDSPAILSEDEQRIVAKVIAPSKRSLSLAQAVAVREASKLSQEKGGLTDQMVREILFGSKKPAERRVILSNEQLQAYFPEDCTPEMMKKGVLKIMQEWAEEHASDGSNRIRDKGKPDDPVKGSGDISTNRKGDQKNV